MCQALRYLLLIRKMGREAPHTPYSWRVECGPLCRAGRWWVLSIHQPNLDTVVGGAHTLVSPRVLPSVPTCLLRSMSAHLPSSARPSASWVPSASSFPEQAASTGLGPFRCTRARICFNAFTVLKFFMLFKQVGHFHFGRLRGQPFPDDAMGRWFKPPVWGTQCSTSPWGPSMCAKPIPTGIWACAPTPALLGRPCLRRPLLSC